MPVEKQIYSIFSVTNGYLDTIPVAEVRRWEREFHQLMDAKLPQVGEGIRTEKALSKDNEASLRQAIERFTADFVAARPAAIAAPRA